MRLCSWNEANAMVDGWGERPSEIYCMACTLVQVEEYAEEYRDEVTNESLISDFLDSAHRGGFVPASVHGFICQGCEKEVQ